MAKSIMQANPEYCWMCKYLDGDDFPKKTEEHHAIGGWGKRDLSEKYGLKVRLCFLHHRVGRMAVHNNITLNRILQRAAQSAFEKAHPELDFIKIFGRNYKDGV